MVSERIVARRSGGAGYERAKRAFDVGFALLAISIGAPVMVVVSVAVRLAFHAPVLFVQDRTGQHGRIFPLYKFRTMTSDLGPGGDLLPDSARLTRFGTWLRKTSLDELPQLLNVLKGDISFVGPRPLLPEYLPLYSPQQARRHEVLPGITGWAQVNGRNAIAWDRKFELDVWYVDHRSFCLDLRIIGLTALKVMRREGVEATGHATMPAFEGSRAPAGDAAPGSREESDR